MKDMPFGLFSSEIIKLHKSNIKTLGDVVNLYCNQKGIKYIDNKMWIGKILIWKNYSKNKHFLRIMI